MSTVKKHSGGTNGNWESVASSEASGITTNNILLTKDVNNEKSVEDVLIEHDLEIETLKKNVSWLALHGGGGYGGGSGSGSGTIVNSNTKVQILDYTREEPVDSIVLTSSVYNIKYKISSRGNSKFTVRISVNGSVKIEEQQRLKNTIYVIPISNLGLTGSNYYQDIILKVVAFDENGDEYSSTCRLIKPEVSLSTNSSTTRLIERDRFDEDSISATFFYSTTVSGSYYLVFSTTPVLSSISDFINNNSYNRIELPEITDSNPRSIEISLKNPLGLENTALIQNTLGTYSLYFYVVNKDDRSILSNEINIKVSVVISEGLAVIPLMGENQDNPYYTTKNSAISLKFRPVSATLPGACDYRISTNLTGQILSGSNILIGKDTSIPINIKSVFGETEAWSSPENMNIIFTVTVETRGYTSSTNIYVTAGGSNVERLTDYLNVQPLYSTKPTRETVIFDYTVNENQSFSNSSIEEPIYFQYENIPEHQLVIRDKGVDTTYDGYCINLNHRASIDVSIRNGSRHWFPESDQDYNSIISKSYPQFTLDLAYWVGNVSNDCVIFRLGDIDSDSLDINKQGILITPETYYVNLDKYEHKGKLQKNSFVHLCITYEIDYNTSTGIIKVYKNGIYDMIYTINSSTSFPNFGQNIKTAYIAAEPTSNANSRKKFVNLKFYSVRLYNSVFNVGQVICSYINNIACNKLLITDGGLNIEKDPTYFNNMLEVNQIRRDLAVGDPDVAISSVFDFTSSTYSWGYDMYDINSIPASLSKLAIPLVAIDVSSDENWTFENFKNTGSASTLISNDGTPIVNSTAKFYYREPGREGFLRVNSTEHDSDYANINISLQGTSTLEYVIKNLEISLQDYLFSPTDSWLPDSSFTLKADVIDSGHYNNAVIGKFVNTCLNNSNYGLLNQDAFPHYGFLKASSSMKDTITAKQCIEGFPVMLVMKFYGQGNDTIKVLGIYSFNLGRNSLYNMGFRIPEEIRNPDNVTLTKTSIVMPNYFGKGININTSKIAVCYEGVRPDNGIIVDGEEVDGQFDFYELDGIFYPKDRLSEIGGKVYYSDSNTSSGILINDSWSNVKKKTLKKHGYFWSTDRSYYNNDWWKEVFNGFSTNLSANARSGLYSLGTQIASGLPYNKGGIVLTATSHWPVYSWTGQENVIVNTGENTTVTIKYPQTQQPFALSIKNAAFYYVVALLFGLVDSFGKNLQLKSWADSIPNNDGSYNFGTWSTTFYDMDTALGLDNKGKELITSTVLDYQIFNGVGNNCYRTIGTPENNEVVSVFTNKLWGFDSVAEVQRQYFPDLDTDNGSSDFYATEWSNLRKTVIKDANKFVDEFIVTQIKDCNLFLINQDFEIKYFNSNDSLEMMHGTRIDFIRSWLRERIYFLDSLFGIDSTTSNYLISNQINAYEIPFKETLLITKNSTVSSIPVEVSSPVIVSVRGEASDTTVYRKLVRPGETVDVFVPSSGTNNTNMIVNNSSLLTAIGLNKLGFNLSNISLQYQELVKNDAGELVYSQASQDSARRNYGNLRNLRVFDLSNVQSYAGSIDFFTLFKTWDYSWNGTDPYPYYLEEINLSNFKSVGSTAVGVDLTGTGDTAVPSIYRAPFKNIVKIDISNSNISNLTIPSGVSLVELNVNYSLITEIVLEGQPLLKPISSFLGCRALRNLSLNKCDTFTSLGFTEANNTSLENLAIINCKNITSINLSGNFTKLKTITVQGNQNLTSFTLTAPTGSMDCLPKLSFDSCPNLTSIDINSVAGSGTISDEEISINSCNKLKTLKVTRSTYKKITIQGNELPKLTTLNLSSSSVSTLNSNEEIINLIGCIENTGSTNTNISFRYNAAVKKVTFPNEENNPVKISSEYVFGNCENLTNIYGNLEISGRGAFFGCLNLKFISPDYKFNGVPVKNSSGKWFHPTEINGMVVNNFVKWYADWYADGTWWKAINIRIKGNGGIGLCSGGDQGYGPRLSTFEIYYFLYNLYSSVTSIDSIFYRLGGTSDRDFAWTETVDNSPHRNTFAKCSNLTSWGAMFYQTSIVGSGKFYRIFSPTWNSEGDGHWNSDGLYSPLKKLKSTLFGITGGVCDKNIFKCNSNEHFEFTTLDISPTLIINPSEGFDVNQISYSDAQSLITSQTTNRSLSSEQLEKIGDVNEIFDCCPDISTFRGFSGAALINFKKITNLGFTNSLKVLNHSFKCPAIGVLDLHKLMKPGVTKTLNRIVDSFSIGNTTKIDGTTEYLTFVLNADTFSGFNSLNNLLIRDIKLSNPESMDSSYDTPFRGSGLRKIVPTESDSSRITYFGDILGNTTTWENVMGLFRGAILKQLSVGGEYIDPYYEMSLQVPGDLFKNQPGLKSISKCFQDLNLRFDLTSEGFSNNTQLNDVSYLFYRTTKKITLQSPIPYKFFYHGENTAFTTAIGSNTDWEIDVDYVSATTAAVAESGGYRYYSDFINTGTENRIKITPASKTWTDNETTKIFVGNFKNLQANTYSNAAAYGQSDPKYYYKVPNRSITNMTYCFSGLNIPQLRDRDYQAENILPEDNSEFYPYKYSFNPATQAWSNSTQNLVRYTMMWEYDGNWDNYYNRYQEIAPSYLTEQDQDAGYSFEYLDEITPYTGSTGDNSIIGVAGNNYVYKVVSVNTFLGVNENNLDKTFCTPPDLFRYCPSSVNISSFFEGCGVSALTPFKLYESGNGSTTYNNISDVFNDYLGASKGYGLAGRLCPYLFKSIPEITTLDNVFRYCKWIGYYNIKDEEDKTVSYVIPKTFFSYLKPKNNAVISMKNMFEGITIPLYGTLSIFNLGASGRLNVEYIFANCKYMGTGTSSRCKLSRVFTSSTTTSAKYAFAMTVGSARYNEQRQYVEFDTVFNSSCTNYDTYVFYGYEADYVLHENTLTVKGGSTFHNYQYYGQSDQAYTGYNGRS